MSFNLLISKKSLANPFNNKLSVIYLNDNEKLRVCFVTSKYFLIYLSFRL